jgi:hypothetical protein
MPDASLAKDIASLHRLPGHQIKDGTHLQVAVGFHLLRLVILRNGDL